MLRLNVTARGAFHLRTCLTAVHTFKQVFERSRSQTRFEFIENHVEEFLRVLLNADVDRFSHVVFKREAEPSWIVIQSIAQVQIREHLLELMQ